MPLQVRNGHVARRAAETTHAASDANTAPASVSTNDSALRRRFWLRAAFTTPITRSGSCSSYPAFDARHEVVRSSAGIA